MSELAYNLNGEPFELPSTAAGWRVRRLKPKGAPEVVFGTSGTPLVLPIDADVDDLRNEVPGEGRYRLDPVDDLSRPIANASSGYVYIHPTKPSPETTAPRPALASADQAVVEAMRINAELSRAVVDQFSTIVDSVASLVRSTAPIGTLSRLFPALSNEDDGDVDETSESAPKSALTTIIDTIVTAAAPTVMQAIMNGGVQIPGGVGALFDCRRASPKARAATEAHATSTPGVVVPAPGHVDPALAPRAAPRPRVATPRTETAPAVASAPVAPARPGETTSALAATTHPTPTPAAELPTLDPAALAHFAAIQRALTFSEGLHARALAAELSPAELRAWMAELLTLSVEQATAKIRTVIRPDTEGASP